MPDSISDGQQGITSSTTTICYLTREKLTQCAAYLESSSHLLFECPTLMAQRQYFPVQTLLKFIKFLSDIMENTDDEIANIDHPPQNEDDK
jgi:hypothetical protein